MLSDTVAAVRAPLYILLAAVIAMLLIGCANLANLLLARAVARQRELAVRAALGAGRARLVAQSIAELVPLMALGGAIGVVAAAWAIDAVAPLLPADLPRAETIALHVPVLMFAAAIMTAITLLVGAWPALEAARDGRSLARRDNRRAARADARSPGRRADRRDLVAGDRRDAADSKPRRVAARPSRVQPGAGLQPASRDSADEVPKRS